MEEDYRQITDQTDTKSTQNALFNTDSIQFKKNLDNRNSNDSYNRSNTITDDYKLPAEGISAK